MLLSDERVRRSRLSLCRQLKTWLPSSGIECVSLGHVNQVEQRAANAKDGRDCVGRLLKRHCACGDFVQAIINCSGLVHIGERNVNRDLAVVTGRRPAVRGRQLGHARICQGHSPADWLLGVFASKAL